MQPEPDPVDDMKAALARNGVDEAVIKTVAGYIRHHWQGRCYIRARDGGEIDRICRAAIEAGAKPAEVARIAGVHRTTISRRLSRWL